MVLCSVIMKDHLPSQLACSLFIGHGSTEEGDISMSVRRQQLVMEDFRKNKIK